MIYTCVYRCSYKERVSAWTSICKFKHGDATPLLVDFDRSLNYLKALQLASIGVDEIYFLISLLGERDWKLPNNGKYKINVDVAFDPTSKQYRI